MSRTALPSVKSLLVSAAALFLLLLSASTARAASFQTFVSVNGNDANTSASCVRTSPCRLIKTALTVTSPGGVLTVLDSGGFGGFTVTQPVQVVAAPGVQATIVPISPDTSTAVTVDAPSGRVTLRGLYLASPGPGSQTGIRVDDVRALHVENCIVAGFGQRGISADFVPVSGAEVFITDTVVRECLFGIFIGSDGEDATRPVQAVIERTRVEGCTPSSCGAGIVIRNNVDAVVRDSVSSGTGSGLIARGTLAGRKAEVMVENCLLTGNPSSGIRVEQDGGGQAIVDVEGTTISFNHTGLSASGNGIIFSRKDNTLRRNTTNGTFTGTFTPQ